MYIRFACGAGKTITNEVFIFDLTKCRTCWLPVQPDKENRWDSCHHHFVALQKHPAEMKLVLIDPKWWNSYYSAIERHYLAKLPDEESHHYRCNQRDADAQFAYQRNGRSVRAPDAGTRVPSKSITRVCQTSLESE